jgi:hypothetical protein
VAESDESVQHYMTVVRRVSVGLAEGQLCGFTRDNAGRLVVWYQPSLLEPDRDLGEPLDLR